MVEKGAAIRIFLLLTNINTFGVGEDMKLAPVLQTAESPELCSSCVQFDPRIPGSLQRSEGSKRRAGKPW